ncbi:hypothetical protein ACQKGA_30075, partial [Priestia megaterium]|uniref:hypothetical protein n=1 Tax=Priestia megaterium TaxID=1404 RepID=UPI003CFDFC87
MGDNGDKISAGVQTPLISLNDQERDFFRVMFVPRFYARQADISETTSSDELFSHFLSTGLAAGLSPTPLFEPEVYREQEARIDPALASQPELVRWCRTRNVTGIVPTNRFDSAFYLETYQEIADANVDPFEHYLRHGLYEGRRPNAMFDSIFYSNIAPWETDEKQMPLYTHYLTFGVDRGAAPSA